MKKILLGISAILLLAGTHAYSTPLISAGAYGDLFNITANSVVYTVVNYRQNSDVWSTSGYMADANPATDTYFTGLYLGTVKANNDSVADLTNLLNYYLGTSSPYSFIKVDAPATSGGNLAITYGPGGLTGTWTLSGDLETTFYSVKAGTGYSLYYLNPGQSSGGWTTAHLLNNGGNVPDISHLTVQTVPGTPVPEPATMLLFGAGLAGLAGIARRKVQ